MEYKKVSWENVFKIRLLFFSLGVVLISIGAVIFKDNTLEISYFYGGPILFIGLIFIMIFMYGKSQIRNLRQIWGKNANSTN